MMMRSWLLSLLAVGAGACSNFNMKFENPDFRLSGRSEDMLDFVPDVIHSFPRGRTAKPPQSMSWEAKYGFLGFTGAKDPFVSDTKDNVYDGLNEVGLSCSSLTMQTSGYPHQPSKNTSLRNLYAPFFCRWALENFVAVEEAAAELKKMHIFTHKGTGSIIHQMMEHFYLADENGHGLVVEWVDGEMQVSFDLNDGGKTGFGILTNAPPFAFQVEHAKFYEWKVARSDSAVALPGGFYPDDRFVRVHTFRNAIEKGAQPKTYKQAVARVVSVLNTVAVPPGGLRATDWTGDHSKWQVVRDHKNRKVFWRACDSPSLQLIDVTKLNLAAGSEVTMFSTEVPEDMPWFSDFTSQLVSKKQPVEQPVQQLV